MRYARWLTLGVIAAVTLPAWAAPDVPVKGPKVPAPAVSPKPIAVPSAKVALKSAPPKVFSLGACGIAQTQCYVTGGKAQAVPKDSPDNMRAKVCASNIDPTYGCGTCEPCLLLHTVGANCARGGCDYKECEKDFVDADGNRKNGCEQYRPTAPATPAGARCTKDDDCAYLGTNDGQYVHAHGECKPSLAGADRRGCVFVYARCEPFKIPSDTYRNCVLDPGVHPDRDGDGVPAPAWGGEDCDDGDPTRFPGNREVCDAYNHDEDCDPHTHGGPDSDGDGLADGACCNLLPGGQKFCGTDCDDKNSGLALSAQRCSPDGSGKPQVCAIDRAGGAQVPAWSARECGSGTTCHAQPNGTGSCF